MAEQIRFAKAGKVYVLDAPNAKGKRVQQLLWGDEIRVLDATAQGDWLPVIARRQSGWLHRKDVSDERLLEINFVDVGQGDGAFLVTPDNQLALVDAGAGSNMRRFLSWRFNLRLDRPRATDAQPTAPVEFSFAVLSHGDKDHYAGFAYLFESEHLDFQRIYHNTLVTRPAPSESAALGARGPLGGLDCYLDLVQSPAQLDALLKQHPKPGNAYLRLLGDAARRFGVERVLGVTAEQGYCHPRPDTLGAIGRYSRGDRPCIFSTELMRSSPEFKAFDSRNGERVRALIVEREQADEQRQKRIDKQIDSLLTARERLVATYGMITLRSDGERVLMAQKLERTTGTGIAFDMQWFSLKSGELLLDQQT